jgi:hypothetical protein
MKKSQQNNEMSILKGLYMDCVNSPKIEYGFLFHNVLLVGNIGQSKCVLLCHLTKGQNWTK